jgi:hypothetical protein
MGRIWLTYMTAERRTAWAVPVAEFTEMGTLYGVAQEWLQKAQDEAERTHVITVQVDAAFKALKAKMRFFRDRYFKLPPLTDADWASLGFREKDTQRMPVPAPAGTPAASLSYPGGPHLMAIHLGPMAGTGTPELRSGYGYAVYVGIMPPGGATLEEAASEKHYLRQPPLDGKRLTHYRFTRRRKEQIVFDAKDAGKTAYVCFRYENDKGDAGLWGPVVSAIIT